MNEKESKSIFCFQFYIRLFCASEKAMAPLAVFLLLLRITRMEFCEMTDAMLKVLPDTSLTSNPIKSAEKKYWRVISGKHKTEATRECVGVAYRYSNRHSALLSSFVHN